MYCFNPTARSIAIVLVLITGPVNAQDIAKPADTTAQGSEPRSRADVKNESIKAQKTYRDPSGIPKPVAVNTDATREERRAARQTRSAQKMAQKTTRNDKSADPTSVR